MILMVSAMYVDMILPNGVVRKAPRFDDLGVRPFDARPAVHIWRPSTASQIREPSNDTDPGRSWAIELPERNALQLDHGSG